MIFWVEYWVSAVSCPGVSLRNATNVSQEPSKKWSGTD